jgi:hypothetical protein
MTYTVTQLITNAWYTSGIVARNLQSVTGDQLYDGLSMLNDVLGIKTANSPLIPYYTVYDGVFVPGQEKYFIPNLVQADSLTFTIDTVRYSTSTVSRRNYFGSPRVNNIDSLPFSYTLVRVLGGTDLYVYFNPSNAFDFQIVGQFGLTEIASNQLLLDLDTMYDRFYIVYLRYALAEYMTEEYAQTFPPGARQKLREFESVIRDINPLDLSMKKMSSLAGGGGINYGDINIGRGWRP